MNPRKLLAKILLENWELKKRKSSWKGMERPSILRTDGNSGTEKNKIKNNNLKKIHLL